MKNPAHSLLTPPCLAFVESLVVQFRDRKDALLQKRVERQRGLDAGEQLGFLAETKSVRDGDWSVAPLPSALLDRRVEITGPVDRKMVINALNSGAKMFMADFEDSNAPSWSNVIDGQQNLYDAVRRTISFTAPETGKSYALVENPATLLVRPRGLHLEEAHVSVDDRAVPGSLFDFGVYFFHNAKELLARGAGPYFYLPKLESHLEARWWNDVFVFAEKALGIPAGTIKATVLIETLPAAFEMDEILYELREHSSGLNCGRWDYIFSFIKKRQADPTAVLPDRSVVTMDKAFLKAYSHLLIKTCHKRKVHAMGGMAAQIPIKNDAAANDAAFAKVRADKEREAKDGHDGTWVAHPGLIPVALEVFDRVMPTSNQISNLRADVSVTEADLLMVHAGDKTDQALRHNIRVGVQYLEAWLRGVGCVPIYNLMEDAATAEISRAQVWQWLKHRITTSDGRVVTKDRVLATIEEEMKALAVEIGPKFTGGAFPKAREMFERLVTESTFVEFLTLPAYRELIRTEV